MWIMSGLVKSQREFSRAQVRSSCEVSPSYALAFALRSSTSKSVRDSTARS